MVYFVQGQGHGLQRRQTSESLDRDFRQCIVIEPQVPQGVQAAETVGWHVADVVGIQTSGRKQARMGNSEARQNTAFTGRPWEHSATAKQSEELQTPDKLDRFPLLINPLHSG